MVVFTASEVDHTPTKSGVRGQLPVTVDESENCTSFPGTLALWSAVAFGGVIMAVIMHVSLELVPQVAMNAHKRSKGNSQGLSRTKAPFHVSVTHSNCAQRQTNRGVPGPFFGCYLAAGT